MTEPPVHHHEIVPEAFDDERLDRVVAIVADVSRSRAGQLIDAGLVRLGDTTVTQRSRRLATGTELSIEVPAIAPEAGPSPETGVELDVLYDDDHVVVIDKPAGLVVHPGAGNRSGTLVNGLVARYPEVHGVGSVERPGIVHRLDKGTSGVMVVARSQLAYDRLVEQLTGRTVGRRYQALCWGAPESRSGVIDAPVGRHPVDRTRMAVVSAGRPSRTHYEVIDRWSTPEVSLLSCRLETGRTHQIRVHVSAIGHAIVGDQLYGGSRSALRIDRPFLHAEHLAFDHPRTGDRLAFDAPLPEELVAVLAALRH